MTLTPNVSSAPRTQGLQGSQGTQGPATTGSLAQRFKVAVGKIFARLLPTHSGGPRPTGPSLYSSQLGVGSSPTRLQTGLPVANLDMSERSSLEQGLESNFYEKNDPVSDQFQALNTDYAEIPKDLQDVKSEYANIPQELQVKFEYANIPQELQVKSEYANIPQELQVKSEYANIPHHLLQGKPQETGTFVPVHVTGRDAAPEEYGTLPSLPGGKFVPMHVTGRDAAPEEYGTLPSLSSERSVPKHVTGRDAAPEEYGTLPSLPGEKFVPVQVTGRDAAPEEYGTLPSLPERKQ